MADEQDPQIYEFTPVTPKPDDTNWPSKFRLYKNSWLKWDELEASTTLWDASYVATARLADGPLTDPPRYILEPAPGYGLLNASYDIQGLGLFTEIVTPLGN